MAKSSTEAEYRALSQATTEILWLKSLFVELGFSLVGTAVVWCDKTGASALAQNPVFHAHTKHIEVDFHFVREKIASGLLTVQYIPTTAQRADIFTKAMPITQCRFLVDKLNLVRSPQFSLRGYVNNIAETNCNELQTSAIIS